MRMDKIAVSLFVLVIAGSILITACPGPNSNSNQTNPSVTYVVVNETAVTAEGSIRVDKEVSASGGIITITATPNLNRAVLSMSVRNSNGHEILTLARKSENVWDFTMPESNVRITATFGRYFEVLDKEIEEISAVNSWADIFNINTLIRRVQSEGIGGVTTALDKLETIIKEKIQAENVSSWLDGTPASHATDLGGLNNSETNIYFVMSQNNNTYPIVNVPASLTGYNWKASEPVTEDHYNFGTTHKLIDITCTIGTTPTDYRTVTQHIWLIPVAQYQVTWDTGSVSFTLEGKYKEPTPGGGHVPGSTPKPFPTTITSFIGDYGPNVITGIWTSPSDARQVYTIKPLGGDEYVKTTLGVDINKLTDAEFIPDSRLYKIDVGRLP